jgi:hypothetical protein
MAIGLGGFGNPSSGNFSRDVDGNGNYLLDDQTTTNMMSKGTVYRFDGVDDKIVIPDSADLSFGDGTSDSPFTFSADLYIEDATNFIIIAKGVGGGADREYKFNINASDRLAMLLEDESGNWAPERIQNGTMTAYEGKWVNVAVTYDGGGGATAASGIAFYINGIPEASTATENASYVAMENLGGALSIGWDNASTYAGGSFANVQLDNFARTAAEVKDLISGNIPFKWQYGSQTDLVSNGGFPSDTAGWAGSDATIASVAGGEAGNCLEVTRTGGTSQFAINSLTPTVAGKRYRLTGWLKSGTSGDELARIYITASGGDPHYAAYDVTSTSTWTKYTVDFTQDITDTTTSLLMIKNSSTAGTMLFDSISLIELGAVALYTQDSISETAWYDKANGNDGAVTGASVLNPHGHAVDSAGAIPGILFPVTQVASSDANMLDDYEEGTFTPTAYYQNGTDQANVSYTTQTGWYTKIGNLVTATIYLNYSISSTPPANDNCGIGGLPFPARNSTNYKAVGACTVTNSASVPGTGYVLQTQSNSQIFLLKDGEDAPNLGNEVGTGAHVLTTTISYQV